MALKMDIGCRSNEEFDSIIISPTIIDLLHRPVSPFCGYFFLFHYFNSILWNQSIDVTLEVSTTTKRTRWKFFSSRQKKTYLPKLKLYTATVIRWLRHTRNRFPPTNIRTKQNQQQTINWEKRNRKYKAFRFFTLFTISWPRECIQCMFYIIYIPNCRATNTIKENPLFSNQLY